MRLASRRASLTHLMTERRQSCSQPVTATSVRLGQQGNHHRCSQPIVAEMARFTLEVHALGILRVPPSDRRELDKTAFDDECRAGMASPLMRTLTSSARRRQHWPLQWNNPDTGIPDSGGGAHRLTLSSLRRHRPRAKISWSKRTSTLFPNRRHRSRRLPS